MPKFQLRAGEHLKIAKSAAHAEEQEHPSAKLSDSNGFIHGAADGSTVVELSAAHAKSVHESNPGALTPLDNEGASAFVAHDQFLGRSVVEFAKKKADDKKAAAPAK